MQDNWGNFSKVAFCHMRDFFAVHGGHGPSIRHVVIVGTWNRTQILDNRPTHDTV